MVVCKCRKATKFYCFVHKTPVCFDCICSQEHSICFVGLYSDWVNDGDYDWPPKCSVCTESLESNEDKPVVRLSCLHLLHVDCLDRHLSSFPSHTAPAGYVCPTCSSSIWPSRTQKDALTALFTSLRSAISKSSASSVLLSSATSSSFVDPALLAASHSSENEISPAEESQAAGQSEPLQDQPRDSHDKGHLHADSSGNGTAYLNASSALPPVQASSAPSVVVLPRKPTSRVTGDKVVIDMSGAGDGGYDDDEDGTAKKYARRGSLYAQFVRYVGSIWAPAIQALPISLSGGSKKDREERSDAMAEDLVEGRARRRHHGAGRKAAWDPCRLLLALAVVSCMLTMMLLYYRMLQGALGTRDEQQA